MKSKLIRTAISICIMMLVSIDAMADTGITVGSVNNAGYHPVLWQSPDKTESRVLNLVSGKFYRNDTRETLEIRRVVIGDLNGDGKNDAAVILSHNTGGSGSITQIAAVLDIDGVPVHVASRNLGDRSEVNSIKIVGDSVKINVTSGGYYRGHNKTVTFRLKGKQLVGPSPFKL
ncbi:MAG: hypothetical protein HGA31_04410 [Candidatus Moranbacteria bacterium]|nr:hypothetical protein [Candidatus Moranbacteria bacterium]